MASSASWFFLMAAILVSIGDVIDGLDVNETSPAVLIGPQLPPEAKEAKKVTTEATTMSSTTTTTISSGLEAKVEDLQSRIFNTFQLDNSLITINRNIYVYLGILTLAFIYASIVSLIFIQPFNKGDTTTPKPPRSFEVASDTPYLGGAYDSAADDYEEGYPAYQGYAEYPYQAAASGQDSYYQRSLKLASSPRSFPFSNGGWSLD